MTLATGIQEASHETYHGAGATTRPALSASIAKILLGRSPLHAWYAHADLNPRWQPEHKASFDLGNAAHVLFLEGDKYAEKVSTIDADNWQLKIAKEHKAASREAGMIPLLLKDWERTVAMVEAVTDQLAARDDDPPLFDAGKPEQAIIWEEDGILCKARLDYLRDDHRAADDLKSVPSRGGTANPHDWSRTFWGIGADIEARFHARGVKALTGREPKFRFCVAEAFPPYAISVVDLAPSTIALADRKVDRALAIWKDCLERDYWPGYEGTASVEVDSWRESDFLARHWEPDEELAA
jgi:hypothetical protein